MVSSVRPRTGLLISIYYIARAALAQPTPISDVPGVHAVGGPGHPDRRAASLINGELATIDHEELNGDDVASALAEFEGVWDCLAPREQSRIVELLVERVSYDGHAGSVVINFRPS